MYRYFRNTHLFLGLFCCLFLLMYGVSAVQMAHNPRFTLRPATTETLLKVPHESSVSARAVAFELMTNHAMRGELAQVTENPAGWKFRIVRPGTVYEVDFLRQQSEVRVKTHTARFMGMLNRIHHIAGMRHEYTPVNIWGFFVFLVSAMLIGIGLTGAVMWFKLHTERISGAILLAVSLGYSLTLIFLLRTA